MIELDHVFCFCDPELPELKALERAGFQAHFGRVHPGQGTANRSVLFEQSYLELIYLADRGEAERNALRLDRRADWRATGCCPFGVGLRGELPEADRERFFAYEPDYGPDGWVIWIHRDNEHHPERPLVFLTESTDEHPRSSRYPVAWAGELTQHDSGATHITRVTIEGPDLDGWPLRTALDGPEVELRPADRPRMRVALEGAPFDPVEPSALLSLAPTRGAGP